MKNIFNGLFDKFKLNNHVPKTCTLCGKLNVNFLPLPSFYKEEASKYGYKHFGKGEMTALKTYSCEICGASDRERLYAYWIDRQIQAGRFQKGSKLIHFAPEVTLSKKLRELNLFDYETADNGMEGVDYKIDLTKMPEIESELFDFFICSHVLEHVDSDDKAIQELYRITKTGGCGILMAPIIVGLEYTIENPSMTTEAERWQHFGQNDHVRLYAHNDYVQKLKVNGFMVDELGIEYFGEKTFKQLGLKETSILYVVRKK